MQVSLPLKKQEDVLWHCRNILNNSSPSIRDVARTLGKIIATFPALPLARAHYRYLEWDKIRALRLKNNDYSASCYVSFEAKQDLLWCIDHLVGASAPIRRPPISLEFFADASSYGWGSAYKNEYFGGFFSYDERQESINTKETLAVLFTLLANSHVLPNNHVLVRSDNTTAVSVISKMGTMKDKRRDVISRRIWDLIDKNNSWLTISHVSGINNVFADFASRNLNPTTEWALDQSIFDKLVLILGRPSMDLFASRLNNKLLRYASWFPDPTCEIVDAFTIKWVGFNYIFPPFVLISRILAKIQAEEAQALLIVPGWTTQSWFPLFMNLLTSQIIVLPPGVVRLPWNPMKCHPIQDRLHLIAATVSGSSMNTLKFRNQLRTSSHRESDVRQGANTIKVWRNGTHFLWNGAEIPITRL